MHIKPKFLKASRMRKNKSMPLALRKIRNREALVNEKWNLVKSENPIGYNYDPPIPLKLLPPEEVFHCLFL